MFVLLMPLGSRLSLMGNPIFSQLARAWGLNIRFLGIDAQHRLYDFRRLLSDRALRLLVDALGQDQIRASVRSHTERPLDAALDVLFEALAGDLLTVLDRRRDDWGRHLVTDQSLEPEVPGTLFDRAQRLPDYWSQLRLALREDVIDVELYSRVLRSIDLRERSIEQRIAAMLEGCLDENVLNTVRKSKVGAHLGCYNWLLLSPRHAMARAHCITRLPFLATVLAEGLVPVEASLELVEHREDDTPDPAAEDRSQPPTYNLKSVAARQDSAHTMHWNGVLRRAIDAGQDRAIIEALAQRFAVSDNVIRRLWRESPTGLGFPPSWHFAQMLQQLQQRGDHGWPTSEEQWLALMAQAIPKEAV
jgi:hypothetical protein